MSRFADTTPPGSRVFDTRVRVQWADVDIAGMMYFAAYQRAVERAEMDFFRELGFGFDGMFDRFDIWLPRVHVEADYYTPAFMDDWLDLRTHIRHVGGSSVKWQTILHNERTGAVGATMMLTVACIDRATLKSRHLPPELRDALRGCLGTPG